jgi:hypothetical protein
MAKTTTKSTSAKSSSGKAKTGAGTKSNEKAKAAPRKAVARTTPKSEGASSDSSTSETIVDALLKLLESPLVADLLAVGATAALSAVAESRFSRRDDGHKSSRTVKNAGKAAAAAMGRRLNEEMEAIRDAAKAASAKSGETAGA